MLDIDNPVFQAGLDRLWRIAEASAAAHKQGGIVGAAEAASVSASPAAAIFARLYLLPAKRNELPQQVRLQPAW